MDVYLISIVPFFGHCLRFELSETHFEFGTGYIAFPSNDIFLKNIWSSKIKKIQLAQNQPIP